MKRKIVIGFVLLLLVFLGVLSYKWNKKGETVDKVTIAMVTFPGYAPLYVAKEKGFFEGVDVELRRIEDIGQMRSAMQSGSIDIYAATYDIFQSTKGINPPGIGFLAMDESHGGDGVAVTSDIRNISEFKGKKVAAEPGFPPYFVLQYLLDEAGLTLKDVNFQDLSSQDGGNAFVAKQFDIVATYEPYLSISAEKREGAKVLYSSADVPGLIVDWLFANEALVKEKPEVLASISKGWFKALEFIESNPDEAYKLMGDAFGVPKQEMIDFKSGISWLNLEDNKMMFESGSKTNAFNTFRRVGDILRKNNETDIKVNAEDHLTDSIIKMIK